MTSVGIKSRVHPRYKTKYRVKNWSSYDRAQVRRGDITVWLSLRGRVFRHNDIPTMLVPRLLVTHFLMFKRRLART